jgi:hypothetical protein
MKRVIILYVLLSWLMASCYEPYFPETESVKKVLVVNGLITDANSPNHIILSYAESFDSTSAAIPVISASVIVSDNLGNSYLFQESGNGDYVSDPSQFRAMPGYTYSLHIITNDGFKYESEPQHMAVSDSPETIYPEYANKETISKQNGDFVLSHGASIMADIENSSDTIPRFRYTSHRVTQYYYVKSIPFVANYNFYCWQSEEANSDINLTGGDYAVNSASINRHEICFIDDNASIYALDYKLGSSVTTEYNYFPIHNKLVFFNRYCLNNDAYLYYKSMNEQLRSDGKLFDPIAVQIVGNIRCISNPGHKVFGFFEASSVVSSAYLIDFRNIVNGQPALKKIHYILPAEPAGHQVDIVPSFWIN